MSSKNKPPASEEIGPGNPPKDTRFKPGQSGNPRGRPKGAKNFSTIIQQQMRAKISIVIDGKPRRMTVQEVIARRLASDSMKGSARSIELLFKLASAPIGEPEAEINMTASIPDKEALKRISKRLDRFIGEDVE